MIDSVHDFTPSSYEEPPIVAPRGEVEDTDRAILRRELHGQYQLVRLLGRGATGAVYLARDIALHRVVAIKVLRWELLSSADDAARFRREARTSAQLSHPGIVPLHGFAESANAMYMVLRYVPGESLGARLRRARRLSAEDTRHLLADLALILEYAHRQGIVHRDLKPENILLEVQNGSSRPMLMDFGVATKTSYDPPPGELRRSFGTPHFMSPEQVAGSVDLDGRTDLYALGVLGYLMLTGELPFTGDTVQQVFAKHAAGIHLALREAAPGAPCDLVDAIERCLQTNPEQRWRYARDLHAALTARRTRLARLGRAVRQAARASSRVLRRVLEVSRFPAPFPTALGD